LVAAIANDEEYFDLLPLRYRADDPLLRRRSDGITVVDLEGNRPTRALAIMSASSSAPIPFGVTSPIPVMTTRSMFSILTPRRGLATAGFSKLSGVRGVLVVVDRILNGTDLLRVLVRDVDLEGFLECQYELYESQRVGAQIVDERGLQLDVFFVDVELLFDDPLNFGRDVATFSH
jgi:hypothetical protein